jgi:hypothetical protein
MAILTLEKLRVEVAPFRAPDGNLVLLLYDRDGRLLTRTVATPFQVQFPTAGPGPLGPFCSDFAPLWAHAPRRWPYGVHKAPWPSIVYSQGAVLIAVDNKGRWLGECEIPPGHEQRAHLALWELLTTGDAIKAERIATGPMDRVDAPFDPAVVTLLIRSQVESS